LTSPVDWDLAQRVAIRIAARDGFDGSDQYDALRREFDDLTEQAEELVAAETGLVSLEGKARGRVADRPMWIRANIASFQRLLRPITDKFVEEVDDGIKGEFTRRTSGVQVGAILGWMSTKVLGQYDLLLTEDENPEDQDIVYYVGPNVMALEQKHNFDTRQFRLWLALHECTHRAQFTGVPWLRDHFVSLTNQTLDSVDPDPQRLIDAAKEIVSAKRRGDDALADGGLPMLIASPEQREVLNGVMGMMSLLEGHGDITMDRAGAGLVPDAEHFSQTLKQRRNSASGATKLLQRIVGLEAKMNQYQQGETFIEEVEKVGGPELVTQAWQGPEYLPSLAEIREPKLWLDRIPHSRASLVS